MPNLIKKPKTDMELELLSKSFRKDIFIFKTNSGFGHLASSLSCVEILVSLFFDLDSNFDLVVVATPDHLHKKGMVHLQFIQY